MLNKLIKIVVGSTILGFGIAIAIISTHGGDSISVFTQGVANTFHLSIGDATLLFYIVLVIPASVVDKKQLQVGTILSPLISSITLDFFLSVIPYGRFQGIITYILMFVGIVCIGIGLGIYVSANGGRSSYDALVIYVSEKLKCPLWVCKNCGDFILCVLGYFLGGQIGWGPVVGFLLIGPTLQKTLTILTRKKNN